MSAHHRVTLQETPRILHSSQMQRDNSITAGPSDKPTSPRQRQPPVLKKLSSHNLLGDGGSRRVSSTARGILAAGRRMSTRQQIELRPTPEEVRQYVIYILIYLCSGYQILLDQYYKCILIYKCMRGVLSVCHLAMYSSFYTEITNVSQEYRLKHNIL